MRITAILLLFSLVAAAPTSNVTPHVTVKPDAPDGVKRYIAYCVSIRPKLIQSAVIELDAARHALGVVRQASINASSNEIGENSARFTTLEAKNQAITKAQQRVDDWTARLAKMRDPSQVPDCPLMDDGTTGDLGLIGGFKIRKIIDRETMIGEPIKCDGQPYGHEVWFTGVSTRGLIDGETVSALWLVKIGGSHQFTGPDNVPHTIPAMWQTDIDKWVE